MFHVLYPVPGGVVERAAGDAFLRGPHALARGFPVADEVPLLRGLPLERSLGRHVLGPPLRAQGALRLPLPVVRLVRGDPLEPCRPCPFLSMGTQRLGGGAVLPVVILVGGRAEVHVALGFNPRVVLMNVRLLRRPFLVVDLVGGVRVEGGAGVIRPLVGFTRRPHGRLFLHVVLHVVGEARPGGLCCARRPAAPSRTCWGWDA